MRKRSNAPVFWLLFGAGGMLSALFGTALVFITGIAAPLAWPFGADFMSYPRILAFSPNWFATVFGFVSCLLFSLPAVPGGPRWGTRERRRRPSSPFHSGSLSWRDPASTGASGPRAAPPG